MKKICVLIPTYNEEENVKDVYNAVTNALSKVTEAYAYDILFIDNASTDSTRTLLRGLAAEDKRVKCIFNAKNFGFANSQFYGLLNSEGDCTMLFCGDWQEPVELLPVFISEWTKGAKIVIGQKTSSEEKHIMYVIRTLYYKLVKKFSSVEQIEHFTGFGLYDKSFINVLRTLEDPLPFLRGIVAEFGYNIKIIPYTQHARQKGKSSFTLYKLYDLAMLSLTSYTKVGLRLAVFIGFFASIVSFILGLTYLVLKLIYWDKFPAGTASILIGMMFLGSVQLFFIGMIGEYILTINTRLMKRPLVIEEERVNF